MSDSCLAAAGQMSVSCLGLAIATKEGYVASVLGSPHAAWTARAGAAAGCSWPTECYTRRMKKFEWRRCLIGLPRKRPAIGAARLPADLFICHLKFKPADCFRQISHSSFGSLAGRASTLLERVGQYLVP